MKRGKKFRAFCYRVISVGALFVAVATAVMGREAFVNLYEEPEILTGDFYYLTEFREFVGRLYNTAMTGYAGVGDDGGHPLTGSYAADYSDEMVHELYALLGETDTDIVFYLQETQGQKEHIYSNVSYPLFSEYDGHLMLPEGMRLCCYWDGAESWLQFFDSGSDVQYGQQLVQKYYVGQYGPNQENAAGMRMVLAVRDQGEITSMRLNHMRWQAQRYQSFLITFLVSIFVWLFFGILGLVSGRAYRAARADFGRVSGRVWLEAKLLLIVLGVWLLYLLHPADITASLRTRLGRFDSLWIAFPLGCLLYLLCTDLQQNGGRVFVNSLPVKCFRAVRTFVRSRSWYRRAMCLCGGVLVGAVVLLAGGAGQLSWSARYVGAEKNVASVMGVLMVVMGVVLLYCFARQCRLLRDTGAIVSRLSQIREGAAGNTPFTLPAGSLLSQAAQDLNELENGIENAVEQKDRSNRMRVELLTNVSHDLKTPLTSIVNYADLLCEEELPETAAEYAAALQVKAYRLKDMVQDVFDLSKATSGNLRVEKSRLDLVKLIRQTLADMDERIRESGLAFRLNIAEEPLPIEADGDKLYRVFQNLFVNALQYSLEGSRVYVQLAKEGACAVARVKNTSRMELNFDPEEIVERFVRADSSRTTEGSGLGLSIVRSYTEACGGEFTILTDADMFTACVRFPLSQEPVEAAPTEDPHETEK